ncbi:hypothetical protein AB0395_21525 [Streptosporangium sp. NPDC051023]|uniref:hypothetical protein n=1 Tax=Streptosporangium sp. NPDC051023 TaxID=3155410 RepID=UPI003451106F
MQQVLGLGDYEGRTYAGFHRHGTLVSAAHLFFLLETAPQPKRNGHGLNLYQVVSLLQTILIAMLWRRSACHRDPYDLIGLGRGP